jgi:hypothetical protein
VYFVNNVVSVVSHYLKKEKIENISPHIEFFTALRISLLHRREMTTRLSNESFYIDNSTGKPLFCSKLPGISFVVFHSSTDEVSQNFMGQFRMLPGSIHMCTFAECDIYRQREVIWKSNQTSVPIRYVPFMILYINGKPADAFPRAVRRTLSNIQQWIVHKIRSQDFLIQDDADNGAGPAHPRRPAVHPLGIPYNRKGTYMPYAKAYPLPRR